MLASAAGALRSAVLLHLRIPCCSGQQTALPALNQLIQRGFASGFLDRSQVTDRVIHVAKHFEKVDPAKVTATAHFEKDMGLDSLDVVELVMALEEEFQLEIPDKEADKIQSVEDAINYVVSNPMAI